MPIFDRQSSQLGAFRRAVGLDPTFADQSDILKNKRGQFLQFTHVPTGAEVDFKAFLTSFSDSYQSQWTNEPAYGKMDGIHTFQATSRAINIGFSVPAASVEESVANLQKISALINMLYPVFEGPKGSQTIKSAPLIKLKFMNWVSNAAVDGSGLLGKLDGVTYAPNMEVGVFQIGKSIYPKRYDVSINYTVIHEETLGWSVEEFPQPDGSTLSAYNTQNALFPYGVYNGEGTTATANSPNRENPEQTTTDNFKEAKEKKILNQ